MNTDSQQGRAVRRSAARLAAVQALYQIEESGVCAEDIIKEFVSYRLGKGLEEVNNYANTDVSYFSALVTGVSEQLCKLDNYIIQCLSKDWTIDRLGPLMLSILRAGAFELVYRPDIPKKVAISEYVELAHDFFDRKDVAFVNGALDNIAKKVIPEKLE